MHILMSFFVNIVKRRKTSSLDKVKMIIFMIYDIYYISPLKYSPLVLRLNYTSELGENFEYKICKNSNTIHDLCVNNTENAQKY